MTLPLTAPLAVPVVVPASAPSQPVQRAPDSTATAAGQPAVAPASTRQSFSSLIDAMVTMGEAAPSLPTPVGEALPLSSLDAPGQLAANMDSGEPGPPLPSFQPLPQLLHRAPAAPATIAAPHPANEAESPENAELGDAVQTMIEAPIEQTVPATAQQSAIDSLPAPRAVMQSVVAGEAARPAGGETADAGTGVSIEAPAGAKPDAKPLVTMPVDLLARPGVALPDPVQDRPAQAMPATPDPLDERWITSLALAVDRAADGEGPDLTLRSTNLGLIQFGLDKIADGFVLTLNASSDSSAALMAAAQDRLLREAMAQNVRLSVQQPGTEQFMGSGFASAGDGRGHGAPMGHDGGHPARPSAPVAPDRRESEQSVDHVAGNVRHRFA